MVKGNKAIRKKQRRQKTQKEQQAGALRKSVGASGRGNKIFDAYGLRTPQTKADRLRLYNWKLGTSFGAASKVRYIDPSEYKIEDSG